MAVTLYVGNLPWALTEDELSEAFSGVGPIAAARIITERETGRSRGFGFVEVNDDDAPNAIETMNGFDLNGRKLIVDHARPRPEQL